MADHVRIAAILRIIHSSLWLLVGAILFLFFGGLTSLAALPLGFIFSAIAGILFVCALPGLITGWGMLTFRPWARILGIVFAILDLPAFPIGTAIGLYSLWVLFQPDTIRLFERGGPSALYS